MTTSTTAPVCDGCGRARKNGRRWRGADGTRVCQRCYQNARSFDCPGCGERKRVATAVTDPDGSPYRCADCVTAEEDSDRLIAIACHIDDVEPDLPAEVIVAAVVAAAPSPAEQTMLAENLGFFPGSLTSGAPSATRALCRLIARLEEAGAANVVRPGCGDCGRARELVNEVGWGVRICAICRRQRRAEPCGRCGAVATVHRRTEDGTGLCRNCWNRDPASWQVCARCRQTRRSNGRDDHGRPICVSCYQQGRPTERCDRCGRHAPVFSRHDGKAWCARCYRHVRPRRRCGGCGRVRPINKRARDGQPDLCAACNWAPITTCSRCNDEAMCRHAGKTGPPVCLRCLAMQRLDGLLTGPDGTIAPAFDGLRDAFIGAHQPRSLMTWLERSPGAVLLARLATGQIDLDHTALDQLDQTPALHHLRQLLIACGALPERDPYVAAVEHAIRRHEATLASGANQRALRAYGTWHELAGLRRRWPAGDTSPAAAIGAQDRLRVAAGLLRHLEACDIPLDQLDQPMLDAWLAAGTSTRGHARPFVLFASRRGLAPAGLDVPQSRSRDQTASPPLADQQRWQLARRMLHDDTLDPADRVVGALVLLYAQPLSRIARLTLTDIADRGDRLTLTFGKDDLEIPEPLAGLLRQLPWRRQIGPSGVVPDADRWLFPGRQAGRHIHPDHLRHRMLDLGIPPRAARQAALLQLAREVPAAVLADTLNIDVGTATRWAARSGANWTGYAADRLRT